MIRILLLTASLSGAIVLPNGAIDSNRASRAIPDVQRPADVISIFHGYNGTVETTGILDRFQYTGGHMVIEFHDDVILRDGFDGSAQ